MPSTNVASRHLAVAPAWHTAIVLLVLLCISLVGARSGNQPFGGAGRAWGYVFVMVFEWVLVAFIWYGVSRRGVSIRDLVRGSWPRPVAVLRDLGIAIGFLAVSQLILSGVSFLLKATPNQAIRNVLPQSPAEIVLFLTLSATAGFCEELIYRGYLYRQFAAATRTAAGGIVLQAVAFGVSHGYQGWRFMVIITVFGGLFGLLAYWQRSLRPGMIAHFVQDSVGGTVGRHFLR